MIAALSLSAPLRAQLEDEARAAFPKECCGLIEGVCEGGICNVTALHRTENLSDAPDRFEIDPAAHVALLRKLRGTKRAIVGCYHSHPNGKPEPSPRDRDRALDEDFVWLIQPVTAGGAGAPGAFVFAANGFHRLALRP